MFSVVSKWTAVLVFVLPSVALSADLTCTLPAASIARGVELCEELRSKLGIRTAEWSNDVCATQFLRIGLRVGEQRSTERVARMAVRDNLDIALNAFDADWPMPVRAICGDGTLDTEFQEECDDGNQIDGDGCSASCHTE